MYFWTVFPRARQRDCWMLISFEQLRIFFSTSAEFVQCLALKTPLSHDYVRPLLSLRAISKYHRLFSNPRVSYREVNTDDGCDINTGTLYSSSTSISSVNDESRRRRRRWWGWWRRHADSNDMSDNDVDDVDDDDDDEYHLRGRWERRG